MIALLLVIELGVHVHRREVRTRGEQGARGQDVVEPLLGRLDLKGLT